MASIFLHPPSLAFVRLGLFRLRIGPGNHARDCLVLVVLGSPNLTTRDSALGPTSREHIYTACEKGLVGVISFWVKAMLAPGAGLSSTNHPRAGEMIGCVRVLKVTDLGGVLEVATG